MATPGNSIISALDADTTPAATDLVATVDVSDTTDAASGTTKKVTLTNLNKGLPAFTGDSGSGGAKGLVPAPSAGDAAAGKFLKADGTFTAPTGGSGGLGDVVGPASSVNNAVVLFNSTTGKLIKQGSSGSFFYDGSSLQAGDGAADIGAGGARWRDGWFSRDLYYTTNFNVRPGGFGTVAALSGVGSGAVDAKGAFRVKDGNGNGSQIIAASNTQAQFTADQDNLVLSGPSQFQRWSSDATWHVKGMIGGSNLGNNDGQEYLIVNHGSNDIILDHQAASSTATNRYICPGAANLTIGADEAFIAKYDGPTGRYRVWKL